MRSFTLLLGAVLLLGWTGAPQPPSARGFETGDEASVAVPDRSTGGVGGADSLAVDSVLVYSGTAWYRHAEIPALNGWLAQLGAEHGFEVHVTETAEDLTPEVLDRYPVLVLNSTTDIGNSLNEKQKQALKGWFRDGGGLIGLHAALVHHDTWAWFSELAATGFNSDSNFERARVTVDPEAREHPAVEGFGPEFWYRADWTNHTRSVTGVDGVQVLLRVDESTYDVVRPHFETRGGDPMGEDHPVAWTRTFEGGRFFYTELGHDVRSLDTPFGRQHVLGAIRWAADSRD